MTYIPEYDKIWIQEPFEPEGRWIDLRGCIDIIQEVQYPDQLRGIIPIVFLGEINAYEQMPAGWLDWALIEDEVGLAIAIELEVEGFVLSIEDDQ